MAVVSAVISGPSLDIAASPYGIDINQWSAAMKTYRRQWAKGPYMSGGGLASSVLDIVQQNFQVNVSGTDQVDLQTNLDALISAISQFQFTLTLTIDSASVEWNCFQCDYAVAYGKQMINGLSCPVSIQLWRQPVPASGGSY